MAVEVEGKERREGGSLGERGGGVAPWETLAN